MFVQVITGKTSDTAALRARADAWEEEIRPGAIGFLGSTGGVAADGRFVVAARFESEDAARENSDRPEQGEWWASIEKLIEGTQFAESSDIITFLGGGKDTAGFVQVMRGRVTDAKKLAELRGGMSKMEKVFAEARPDVVGEVIALHADGTYTDIVYFSSEKEARTNEAKEMSPEAQEMFEQLMSAVAIDEYIDLGDPWLR
jgi:hypothetical protein